MRKKVLFILHLPPPVHGAAMMGTYIQQSCRIKNSFDTEFINLSTSTSLEQLEQGSTSKIFRVIGLLKNITRKLAFRRYDVCYMTLTAKGPGLYKDLIVVILLKLFRKKIIYHFHNKGVSERTSILNKAIYRFIFRNSQSILLSSRLYYDIEAYVNKKDVFICANGIPEAGRKNFPSKTNDGAACNLLFLSNVMAEKGVYVLLQACAILNKKGYSFECHFVGQWSDISEENLSDAIKNLDLVGKVHYHGKKYGAEKETYFLNADIFVFPTFYHNETFGLVNVEAMQYALPVISTFVGGIPDIIDDGKTGFLVPPKNAEVLADKISFLIDHPHIRKQMGDEGRRKYETCFTLERFENNITSILEKATTHL